IRILELEGVSKRRLTAALDGIARDFGTLKGIIIDIRDNPGGEAFALALKELPHVTIIGDHTNGIFSYQLEKKLPNGWELCLSYQVYLSADMVCYEGKGVPVDIKLLNKKADIENGIDPLITRALEVLKSKSAGVRGR
ncbi:MAG: hypothetical protein QOD29_5493, partial [Alphaproteobacteria bacterium]|nr:hypothetical protein [Alphaproteobacteria bacterium]